uniref:Uncharacterized protein n=1 Tax=Arundo donax TaxID=35708 RepID=A0A0A9HVN0_ARUDO
MIFSLEFKKEKVVIKEGGRRQCKQSMDEDSDLHSEGASEEFGVTRESRSEAKYI